MPPPNPATTAIYHITHVANLTNILQSRGLYSDAVLDMVGGVGQRVIGYENIKQRRLHQYRVSCCGNRFVGEFVPFYFCPRSPMLFTLNKGNNPPLPAGCQRDIVHLVSTVARAAALGRECAFSDGNAGAGYTQFDNDLANLGNLDWAAIRADIWKEKRHEKQAEFLVADFFEWNAFTEIGCQNTATQQLVMAALSGNAHQPKVAVRPRWYY